MNYFILILVAIAGIALGMFIALRPSVASRGGGRRGKGDLISKQAEQKLENKKKILEFVQEHGQVQNNDAEKLAGVSNATAERYLDELEKEGKLTQHGEIGPDVFYTLK